jgi:ribosomal protein S18 acetylase RimI-like enzyme
VELRQLRSLGAARGKGLSVLIRPYRDGDAEDVWRILEPVIRKGETYALPREMARADALAYWTGPDRQTFVAEVDGTIAGTFYLRANQAGGGAHVANCGYVTADAFAGRGIARAMCAYSLEAARQRGFRAMQFNLVVASNTRAVRLWQSLGFEIVGRLPRAFAHPVAGDVDAFVMYRLL